MKTAACLLALVGTAAAFVPSQPSPFGVAT